MNATKGTSGVPILSAATPDPQPRGRVRSPAQLWLVTSICIFAAEWLIMYFSEILLALPPSVEVWADPTVLVVLVTPWLYFLLFRPMATHIEERARAEEDLRYAERKYHALVDGSPTGIYLVRDERIAFANPALVAILEMPLEEVLGADPLGFVHAEDRERAAEIEGRLAADVTAPRAREIRIVTGTGAIRWVVLRLETVPYQEGVSIVGTLEDVTESKRREAELIRTTEALRELSARLVATQEEERRRVARELHEGVGQSLSAVKYMLERAVAEFKPEERRRSMLLLRSAVPAFQAAVDEVRTMSMGLRPSSLDDLGLVATLRWMAREFAIAHPAIRLDMVAELSEEDVPERLKIVVFRVAQEALAITGDHGLASRVSVTVERLKDRLVLRVEEDGSRCDPEEANDQGPLSGDHRYLKERAEISGGRFSCETDPGRGIVIRVEWTVSG